MACIQHALYALSEPSHPHRERCQVENVQAIVYIMILFSPGFAARPQGHGAGTPGFIQESMPWYASDTLPGRNTTNQVCFRDCSETVWNRARKGGWSMFRRHPPQLQSCIQLCYAGAQAKSSGVTLGGVSRCRDHIPLTLTDPLGVSNSIFERLWGIQTDIRVQLHLPTPALPHIRISTSRPLGRSTGRRNSTASPLGLALNSSLRAGSSLLDPPGKPDLGTYAAPPVRGASGQLLAFLDLF
jgi:hypothetical protein